MVRRLPTEDVLVSGLNLWRRTRSRRGLTLVMERIVDEAWPGSGGGERAECQHTATICDTKLRACSSPLLLLLLLLMKVRRKGRWATMKVIRAARSTKDLEKLAARAGKPGLDLLLLQPPVEAERAGRGTVENIFLRVQLLSLLFLLAINFNVDHVASSNCSILINNASRSHSLRQPVQCSRSRLCCFVSKELQLKSICSPQGGQVLQRWSPGYARGCQPPRKRSIGHPGSQGSQRHHRAG